MQTVVGVKFKPVGKIYFFSPNGENYKVNDKVIVDTLQGPEFGIVELANFDINENELTEELRRIIRPVNERDLKIMEQNKIKELSALKTAKDIIKKHNLEMKLIAVDYAFDNSKIIFTFTADGRVDFRELVKELAGTFKSRIELKQIGIRDEAKLLGGIGPCGRPLCCASHLRDFGKVSIKMAKTQGLSLNPTNISGHCGRLMCCLAYENEHYAEIIKQMPRLNSIVTTPDGEGFVIYNNLLKKLVTVKIKQGEDDVKIAEYPLEKIIVKEKVTIDED